MVDIEEMQGEQQEEQVVPPSQERLLDAEEIEKVAQTVSRVSVRLHLESLAKKLRKESEALSRMEKSQSMAAATEVEDAASETKENANTQTAAASTAASSAVVPPPQPLTSSTPTVAPPTGGKYTSIDRFSFDFGGYDSAFVSIYVTLPSVGSIPKEQITCEFTKDSFDLIVRDLQDKSYRLFKDNLEKDINPDKSKFVVKADKVIVTLAKCKGEYGSYDYWSKLTDAKGKKKAASSKENPQASIMQLMKDMYDEGDDNMKKVIGETFMKQQRGELGKDGPGGLGDMKLGDDF